MWCKKRWKESIEKLEEQEEWYEKIQEELKKIS